jgi:hypothetical protein
VAVRPRDGVRADARASRLQDRHAVSIEIFLKGPPPRPTGCGRVSRSIETAGCDATCGCASSAAARGAGAVNGELRPRMVQHADAGCHSASACVTEISIGTQVRDDGWETTWCGGLLHPSRVVDGAAWAIEPAVAPRKPGCGTDADGRARERSSERREREGSRTPGRGGGLCKKFRSLSASACLQRLAGGVCAGGCAERDARRGGGWIEVLGRGDRRAAADRPAGRVPGGRCHTTNRDVEGR